MPGGDRGERTPLVEWVLPTIGIFLALSIALGVGALIGSTPPDPPTKEQQQQYAAAKTRYARAVAGKLPDSETNYSAYPDQNAYDCYYAKQHDSADLCAQWRAAIAAEASARWTFWTLVVSVAGTALSGVAIVGLLLSLRQTERALSEGVKANALAEDTAKRQLRAYIYVELKDTPSLELGSWPEGKFWIKNSGQTPAFDVQIASALTIGKVPFEGDPPAIPEKIFEGGTTHFPNAPSVVICRGAEGGITQPWIDAIKKGQRMIVMYGEIRYTDIYGDHHRTRYRAHYGGEFSIENDAVIWYSAGNDAD